MARMVMLGAGLALLGAGAADAQVGPGAPYPMPGRQVAGPGVYYPPLPSAPLAPAELSPAPQASTPPLRWGSRVDGRWSGGGNAPGGWAAYRRPARGYRVPSYWLAPRFYVADWRRYGLAQPRPGYGWSRYYDDAVMIDRVGTVLEYRGGLDWDGPGFGEDVPQVAYDDPSYRAGPERRVIIRRERGPGYGAPSTWVSPDGRMTVTTSGGGGAAPVVIASGGYGGGGYGGGVTTVTIQGQPVVTTTTTETIEDSVTYSPRRVYRQRVWHSRPTKLRRR